MNKREERKKFKKLLEKYLSIQGLDIVVQLDDGNEVELRKNRSLINNEIITFEKGKKEIRIKLSQIKSVELYAA